MNCYIILIIRRAPDVTLLTQTGKFHFSNLALISQALFKFSLLRETLFDSPISLVNSSQIGSIPLLCKSPILTWTSSCLFQPILDICRHWEPATCRLCPTSPKLMRTLPGTISVPFPPIGMCLLPSALCEQSWMSAGTLNWVFLFTPPMCSLDKDFWPRSLVLTPVSCQGCSLPLEHISQPKLWPVTQFQTIISCSIAYTDLYDSLFSTCWPVSALIRNPATMSWPLTLGSSEINPKIMFFGLNDGASSQHPLLDPDLPHS